jgi:hypothetical protein
MTIPASSSTPALREALYAISLAQCVPDAELLDGVIQRYPQYAAELTDFAIDLALDALNDAAKGAGDVGPHSTIVTPAVSRAMSRFQNRLHAAGRTSGGVTTSGHRPPVATSAAINPFADLSREEFRGFASRIGATTVFVCKLRDRQIEPETVSDGFLRLVADELHAPLDLVVAHFATAQAGEPRAQQFYKADDKPTAGGRQTFLEAVKSSGLSEAQQKRLLSL